MFIFGCEKETKEKEIYVAEVGNTKLSLTFLNEQLGKNVDNSKYREEFIKDWIETEILSQDADERKLLNKTNYNQIIETSSKKLAATIAINEYLSKKNTKVSDSELRRYFSVNRDDYNYSNDAFVLNFVEFTEEESAIKFRNVAISDGWENSLNLFSSDSNLIVNVSNQIFNSSEIQSKRVMRVINRLYKNEISLVVKTELNNFVIVQQIDKIVKNSIPKFKYIKKNVADSYIVLKQKELIRNYLDSLISVKSVKIY